MSTDTSGPPKPPETCYLFRVRLDVLARNLAAWKDKPCDELAAARWLTASVLMRDPLPTREKRQDRYRAKPTLEHSPFKQTPVWGVFWGAEDPILLMEPEELAWVRPVPYCYPTRMTKASLTELTRGAP